MISNRNKKIIVVIVIMMISLFYNNIILAVETDFWGDAAKWFGEYQDDYTLPHEAQSIIDVFLDMINVVGTTVIVVATIVLGIKYIIGTVDTRTSAKEGLITLLVACVFFFGWTGISNLLYPGENYNFIFTDSSDTIYKNMVGRLFSTFSYVANIVSILLIIYVGIKYILAGANGRAELKGRSIYFLIGVILIFATTNVLSFISELVNDVF